jgi:serine/threonine protein kinase
MTDIRERLSPGADLTPAELVDMLGADQVQRWRQGQRVPAEAYLHMHPSLTTAPLEAVDLVFNEFVLREELGETPTVEEFLWRFPDFAPLLRRQIALHRAVLNGNAAPPTDPDRLSTVTGEEEAGNGSPPAVAVTGYEILSEIGRGGMGVVYKAHQRSLKRIVALKMIRDGVLADPHAHNRFRREAEAAARLQHPHIVQVYEVGEQEGQPFIALEYVAGGSLAQQTQGKPQPPADAAALVETLARAVHHAHQAGIIHRDLKPANILLQIADCRLAIDGQDRDSGKSPICNLQSAIPKITDFGLAKQLDTEGGPATQSGAVMGTPGYMAPEQAWGQTPVQAIGPPADVFALGVILYELLTGRAPFLGQNPMDTLQQLVSEEPVAPSRLQPRMPRDLETICLKCLQKTPARRYATAEALAEDLCRLRSGEPILARPVGRTERLIKWARRRPALAGLAAVSLAATLGLVAGGVWYNTRLQNEAERRHALQQRATNEAERRHALQQRATANLQTAIGVLEYELNVLWIARFRGEDVPEPLRQGLLEQAVQFYPKLLASGDDTEPQARREIGRAYFGLGLSHDMLAKSDQAQAHYRRAIACQEQLLADYPNEVDYRIDLAATLLKLAYLQERSHQPEKAKAARSRMVSLVELLPPDHPRLADMSSWVSAKLAEENRLREALPWLDQHIVQIERDARQLQDRIAQIERDARQLQNRTREIQRRTLILLQAMYAGRALLFVALDEDQKARANRALSALTLAHLGDYQGATQQIDKAIKAEVKDAPPLYAAAAVYALAAALVRKDARRSAAEQLALGERYASRALAFLRRCQAAGHFDKPAGVNQLKTDKDFDALRSRADFQKFLGQIRERLGKG